MIAENIVVHADPEKVYQSFADLDFWLNALPDVLAVERIYQDPCQQEFRMTVERQGMPETVRAIRFLYPNRRIELFQPEPPPGFKDMRGIWSFTPSGTDDTLVLATRSFQLASPESSESEVGSRLQEYLRINLTRFRDAIQAGNA